MQEQTIKKDPIFQIDGNFGYTAGVNEMLLQSQLGYVQFLPAIPEQWNTGHVEGIVARGNFDIDMKWSNGKADRFADYFKIMVIHSQVNMTILQLIQ